MKLLLNSLLVVSLMLPSGHLVSRKSCKQLKGALKALKNTKFARHRVLHDAKIAADLKMVLP